MKRLIACIPIFLVFFALALSEESYWNSVRIIEKEIFDKQDIYSISKEELSKLCENANKNTKSAFREISQYFDKSEKIIFDVKDSFEKIFIETKGENISPFDSTQFRLWHEKKKEFFVQIFSLFKKEKNLSLVEIGCPFLKMEFFRETKGKFLRCAMFPYGYAYKCGNSDEKKILFAPTLGFCLSQKECKNCLESARLEFFGSKEYILGLSAIRPLKYSENYICFRFDEKGNVL